MVNKGSETADSDDLHVFCDRMLSSLGRAEQRRWAAIYIRALIEMPGRKSIPRIADRFATGRSHQSLQQFVNQSPWSSAPVRAELARVAFASVAPEVWVIDELVFPKQGTRSAAVAVQFVPTLRRTMRCQLGLGLFIAGHGGAVPVSVRLMEPVGGDAPGHEDGAGDPVEGPRGMPDLPTRWHYVMDLLDEVRQDWALPQLPVIIDARHLDDVSELVLQLERSGHDYVIQVSGDTPLPALTWSRRLITGVAPGSLPSSWTFSWLTNLPLEQADITRIAGHRWRVREVLRELMDRHGLAHFEGRSRRGWQHHVTLVSLAYAFRALADVADWLPTLPLT